MNVMKDCPGAVRKYNLVIHKRDFTRTVVRCRRFLFWGAVITLLWGFILLNSSVTSDPDSDCEDLNKNVGNGDVNSTDPCESANITLVSAYLDIGDYVKGKGRRTVADYFKWSRAFGHIRNPLVFYTDSGKFADHLRQVRSRLGADMTHIILVNRSSTWSFSLQKTISRLYSDSKYPKFHPNTVMPEYSSLMHFKYTSVLDAIVERGELVTSRVYAWIDIGYFRCLEGSTDYCLILPKNFKDGTVLFNQVSEPNFTLTPKEIFYGNHIWVGGGMFIATRDTMVTFCSEYRRAAEFFLFHRNLSSTDQQILYSVYTTEGRNDVNMSVELQVLSENSGWFHLGLSSLHKLPKSADD